MLRITTLILLIAPLGVTVPPGGPGFLGTAARDASDRLTSFPTNNKESLLSRTEPYRHLERIRSIRPFSGASV
jgi:hypothetical protein